MPLDSRVTVPVKVPDWLFPVAELDTVAVPAYDTTARERDSWLNVKVSFEVSMVVVLMLCASEAPVKPWRSCWLSEHI